MTTQAPEIVRRDIAEEVTVTPRHSDRRDTFEVPLQAEEESMQMDYPVSMPEE